MKGLFQAGSRSHAGRNPGGEHLLPLLEQMLIALQKSPEKLIQIQRLIEDLSHSSAGRLILPDDFQSVWEPIQRVAATMQKTAGKGKSQQ
jgi:hypothetical protein